MNNNNEFLTKGQKFYLPFKRFLDILGSFLLIIIIFPLLVILLFVNCFFTNFKPVFIQKRVGKNLKEFYILKIRTLKNSAPNYQEKCQSEDYTGIGFLLRKTHMDELLQLFNIFIGQMSFVGPRPIINTLSNQINKRVEDKTIMLKPGLTGLAQINETKRELTQMEKCSFDRIYLSKFSFGFDSLIFLKTFRVVAKNVFHKAK